METVYFSILHTKGSLKGIVTHDSINFVSAEKASEWRKGMIKKEKRNGKRLVDFTFIKRRCDEQEKIRGLSTSNLLVEK